jgi:hypothetical protein
MGFFNGLGKMFSKGAGETGISIARDMRKAVPNSVLENTRLRSFVDPALRGGRPLAEDIKGASSWRMNHADGSQSVIPPRVANPPTAGRLPGNSSGLGALSPIDHTKLSYKAFEGKDAMKAQSQGFFKDFGVGVEKAFGKGNWANPMVANAGLGAVAGAVGGGMSSAASFLDPDHVQSNGFVKSAVKGAMIGGALGAAHVGIQGARSMTQAVRGGSGLGHTIAEGLQNSSVATKQWTKTAAVTGALGMGMIGSTNIRTRAANPMK